MDDLDKILMVYCDDVSAMNEKQGSSFYEGMKFVRFSAL